MVGVHSAPPLVGVSPELALPVHAWRKGPTPTRRSSSSVGVHSTLWIPTSRWVSRPAPVCGRPCRMVATSIPRSMGVLYTPPSHRITPDGCSVRPSPSPPDHSMVGVLHTPRSHPRVSFTPSALPLVDVLRSPLPYSFPWVSRSQRTKKKAPPEAGLWCWLGD